MLNHPPGAPRQKLHQGQINAFLWAFKPAVCQAFKRLKSRSMPSYGRSSLPFASVKRLKSLKTLKCLTILQARLKAKATPRPDQCFLMGVQACRLPGVKRLKSLKPLKCLTVLQAPQGKSYPKARSMPSYGRSSLPFARR